MQGFANKTQNKIIFITVVAFTITEISSFRGKTILRCGAAPFLFIFVVFSSLAALLVLFPA